MTDRLPRSFHALAAANLGAQSAEQLSLAAVPLAAVLALGAGPAEIGLLGAMQTLPFLLLSIPVGLLTDRMPRRRVMLASEALRALSLVLLLWMVASGSISITGLAVLGFMGALGTVGFTVASGPSPPRPWPGHHAGSDAGPRRFGVPHRERGRATRGRRHRGDHRRPGAAEPHRARFLS